MANLSSQESEGGTLDRVRRHIRILVDITRLAGESADVNRFLDQAAVQVARAVEINHVKILRYRPRTADLLVEAGIGWKEGVVGTATLSADLRSPPGRAFLTAEPVTIKNLNEQHEYVASNFLKEHGILSLANVPVLKDAFSINDAILEVVALTRTEAANNGVSVRTQLAEGLRPVQGDRVQLQQVWATICEPRGALFQFTIPAD
jgi:signal transduction histidine kinase